MTVRGAALWRSLLVWLLPWLAAIGATAGLYGACLAAAALVLLASCGYWIFTTIAEPDAARPLRILAASPLGSTVVFGSLALLARCGVPIAVAGWFVVAVCLVALLAVRKQLWQDLAGPAGPSRGPLLLSTLICCIYFLPSALRDAVLLPDGRWQWMYVDSQYWMAMAASILHAPGRPYLPDLAAADMRYHFGPHAFSAAVSALSGLELADSVARISRPLAQIAFASATGFAAYALGRRSGRPRTAALLAVSAVVLYGSVLSLFAAPTNSVTATSSAILTTLPYVEVMGSGGPFEHLLIGGSMIGGCICLFTVIGLLVTQRAADQSVAPRFLVIVSFVCALGVCSSSVAGLAAAGITAVTVARPKQRLLPLLTLTLPLVLAGAVFATMGLFNAPMSGGLTLSGTSALTEHALSLLVWATMGLGVRHCALLWLRARAEITPAVVLGVAILGFLVLGVCLDEPKWHNSRYGLLYLQTTLSLFAAAAMVDLWAERRFSVRATLTEVCCAALTGWIVCAAAVVLMIAVMWPHRGQWTPAGTFSVERAAEAAFAVVLFGAAALAILRRGGGRWHSAVLAAATLLFSAGACAWVEPYVDFGLGRIHPEVRVAATEYRALRHLRSATSAAETLVTNNFWVPTIQHKSARNYSYGALSERRFVMQGWMSGGADSMAAFAGLRASNELIFNSRDAHAVAAALLALRADEVVARPGTDLAIAAQQPAWLRERHGFAPLRVYAIDKPTLIAAAAPDARTN